MWDEKMCENPSLFFVLLFIKFTKAITHLYFYVGQKNVREPEFFFAFVY